MLRIKQAIFDQDGVYNNGASCIDLKRDPNLCWSPSPVDGPKRSVQPIQYLRYSEKRVELNFSHPPLRRLNFVSRGG